MDLIIACIVVATICVLAYWRVPIWIGKPKPLASWIVVVTALSALAFVFLVKDRLFLANGFPFSTAIIATNLTPVLLSIAAAGALKMAGRPFYRRVGLSIILLLFAAVSLAQPIMQPIIRPVQSSEHTIWYRGGVCQQSSTVTCSPAAAVTLMKAHEIDSNEREMIDLCLTDRNGTATLGLWRGICLATKETPHRPVILDAELADLLGQTDRKEVFPCLILVGFPQFAPPDPVYTKQYGWPPGFRHSVVLFGPHPDGGLDIGDPSIGRERWSEQDLSVLWRGEGIRLVNR
ncbi:cysteine peptidase family C39 domain-containing protein [Stieleria varia]|uniref:Peptidase C39 family protein n=1 Tax=Stieleria varia TaxID=2528005 RepID=A0A5C6BAK5_9BACT|nr:peptidase C39 [Stieleria varia]TWU08296.1 hypothetical protein Pla52n_08780 [Stieleria varia]